MFVMSQPLIWAWGTRRWNPKCTHPSNELQWLNTLRPRQDGRHFADDTFKRIFLNENVRISIKISPKFVPKGPINNIPALVQIMAWRRPGDKPLSEPTMTRLPTHICVIRPQWVNDVIGTVMTAKPCGHYIHHRKHTNNITDALVQTAFSIHNVDLESINTESMILLSILCSWHYYLNWG